MKFIGIDLAWTYKNETGICVMEEAGRIVYMQSKVFSDEEIIEVLKSFDDDAVIAVDAPLIVNNEGGSREAERELMRTRIHGHRVYAFISGRGFLTRNYGVIRGEELMNLILQEIDDAKIGFHQNHTCLVETFPTGVCAGLFPRDYPLPYKKRKGVSFKENKNNMKRIVRRIEESSGINVSEELEFPQDLRRKGYKQIEDKFDAFLCAYGMYMIHHGFAGQLMYGDVNDGFILLPLKS